jgi:hypothetical protein
MKRQRVGGLASRRVSELESQRSSKTAGLRVSEAEGSLVGGCFYVFGGMRMVVS